VQLVPSCFQAAHVPFLPLHFLHALAACPIYLRLDSWHIQALPATCILPFAAGASHMHPGCPHHTIRITLFAACVGCTPPRFLINSRHELHMPCHLYSAIFCWCELHAPCHPHPTIYCWTAGMSCMCPVTHTLLFAAGTSCMHTAICT
jgi:hypothetical protein